MIRLAIVRQKYNPHGGAERFVSRALQALAVHGEVDVTLIARAWQGDAGWHTLKVDPSYLTRTGRDAGFAKAASARFGAFDLVQSHERIPGAAIFRAGDGLHVTWLEQWARVQHPLARWWTRVAPYHRYVLAAERAMFTHPALRCVICNSRMVADDIARRFAMPQERLALVYNGVDTAIFHPRLKEHRSRWREQHRVPAQAPLLAFVGSGFTRKGLATALAAIVPYRELHLAVAGEDRHLDRYRAVAERLGVLSRVRLLGAVADVKPLYGAADALLQPSLYDPFPNACLEALAAGLPIFTSPLCGAAEWVRPGENGWVADALDVAGYRAVLAAWLDHRARWPQLSAEARHTAEPHTLERMAGELTAVYARILGSA